MKGMRPLPFWSVPADFMQASGQPFETALAVTRAGNLFTTHTAVAAGFDRFPPDLIEQYLGGYAEQKLGISLNELLALGRRNPERRIGKFQYGLSGHSRQRGGQWREPLAWQGQPTALWAALPALADGGSARRTRDQRRPRADLGLGAGR
jgi:hypothetical protein